MTTTSPRPAAPAAVRLRPGDLAGLASIGLRTRKLRAGLSALGIAIGVAAIVAVLGLAASSQAALLSEIARLGTNLLTVTSGQTFSGATAKLPTAAPGMIARLPGVTAVQDTGAVTGVNAYKSPLIPPINTNAISVDATTLGLPAVAGTSLAQGRFLNAATTSEPVAVLGATTARLMGIDRVRTGMRIWINGQAGSQAGGQWFYVTGILSPATYASQLDSAVLVGFPAAERYLDFDGHPSQIYVRSTPNDQAVTTTVDNLLGAQANPEHPSQVNVSQPSDALTAQADDQGRARHPVPRPGRGRAAGRRDRGGQHHGHLGAGTPSGNRAAPRAGRHPRPDLRPVPGRGHPAVAGRRRRRRRSSARVATASYAHGHGEAVVIPPEAWAGGLAAAVIIGALAGLLPAIRAARLSPTQALWTV